MIPEHRRREHFTAYAQMLKERFRQGVLSELQPLNHWVVWRSELEDGKKKKVPYNPHDHLRRASVKIPNSWGTLDTALIALETGNYSGLGFMLTPPLVMIDLDNSFDKQTRTITNPQAADIVHALNSYTEASPGNGLHILACGQLPSKGIHTAIEIYGQDRFTTITTQHILGTPTAIEHRQQALEALYRRFAPPEPSTAYQNTGGVAVHGRLDALPPEARSDPVLQELLGGNMSRYGNDHHLADWVLLMKLLHWTGDDVALSKQLFLDSPLGRRAKAQEPEGKGRRGTTNYLDRTIDRIRTKRRNPPMKR